MELINHIYKKDEVIFSEGVYERCMYDIRKGRVDIYVNYMTDNERLLTTLEAGQFFGEIGLTEKLPRTATAVAAVDNTELSEITTENFKTYFYNEPHKVLAIMRNMSARLRGLTEDFMDARRTISEAVSTAKRGSKQSESLVSKLSKLVQNSLKPSFLYSDKHAYDEAAYLSAQNDNEYTIHNFKKNAVIFREGDAANCLYDIRCGSVAIYSGYGTDNQKLLSLMKADELFGEMGLLDKLPRSATAVAMEPDTIVQLISEETFGKYLNEEPIKVITIMAQLSSRIRALTKDYMEVCKLAEEAEKSAKKSEDDYWTEISESYYDNIVAPNDLWGFNNRLHM